MGCFYCDEHHEGREAIMFKVGDMKAGTLYLFKDQAHKGRCALALKSHKKELCECDEQERNDYCADLAAASGAIKKLWGCTKINLGFSPAIGGPHLHFIAPAEAALSSAVASLSLIRSHSEGRECQGNTRKESFAFVFGCISRQTASNLRPGVVFYTPSLHLLSFR